MNPYYPRQFELVNSSHLFGSSLSLHCRAKDWLSNRILSLETSIQLFSFDSAGYPLACTFNLLHLLIRLPHFYSALPPLSSLWSSSAGVEASKYARQAAARQLDADARLAELQGSGGARSFFGSGWVGWTFSVALILISVANTAYVASRRRKYQLLLRKVRTSGFVLSVCDRCTDSGFRVNRTHSLHRMRKLLPYDSRTSQLERRNPCSRK